MNLSFYNFRKITGKEESKADEVVNDEKIKNTDASEDNIKDKAKEEMQSDQNKEDADSKDEIIVATDIKNESTEAEVLKEENVRKKICVCKIGSDHILANKNNHDYAFNLLNMKVVTDGCGSGKHSEIGTKIFAQLFSRKAKEFYDKGESISEENFIDVVNDIFKKMLELCNDTNFIFNNYCFTILVCFEMDDEFVVFSCGDGYIIKENTDGITFEQLDDGEYPAYYVYNFIEDKNCLTEYKDGVKFKVNRFSKEEYLNIGVATDGLRFVENLLNVEKNILMSCLHDGKEKKIEILINRNNQRYYGVFHDDISICF